MTIGYPEFISSTTNVRGCDSCALSMTKACFHCEYPVYLHARRLPRAYVGMRPNLACVQVRYMRLLERTVHALTCSPHVNSECGVTAVSQLIVSNY